MSVMGFSITAGGIYIALTIFFNVFGTYLARVYAFENKAILFLNIISSIETIVILYVSISLSISFFI